MLASRKMPQEPRDVLNDVVKVINHIKAHALNSRLFEQLCEQTDADHRRLLLYAEIRWSPHFLFFRVPIKVGCYCKKANAANV